MSRLRFLIALACIWFFVPSLATAQTATSIIHGTVTDGSGAALVNVTVTATLIGTNSEYRAVTNADGNYVLPGLRPGQYKLSFDLASFRKVERSGVQIEVNQQARVDTIMQVGEVRDTVVIQDDASTIETSNATIKAVIDSRRIVDLPLNGRNALQLQALTPGAIPVLPTGNQASTGIARNQLNSFSINGARPNGSAYYLDGGINMDMYNNLATSFPNPDALQEFSVLASGASTVYGRSAGGAINMVTKSGTNNYHGNLYEFWRDTSLNANNYFSNRSRVPRAPLKRHQYGGTFGGPLPFFNFGGNNDGLFNSGKDKTFFFFSYEGLNEKSGRPNSNTIVPTAAQRNGDFSTSANPIINPLTGVPFAGNIIPQGQINPVAKAFTEKFIPLSNSAGNIFTFNPTLPTKGNQFLIRVDHDINSKNRLTVRYFDDKFETQTAANLPAFVSAFAFNTRNLTVSDSHTFGANVVNTFTGTFNRNPVLRTPLETAGASGWEQLGCISCVRLGGTAEPTDWFLGITGGFTVQMNTKFDSLLTNWHFTDNLSWVTGRQVIRIGGEFGSFTRLGIEPFQHTPQFSFSGARSVAPATAPNGFADFYLGLPTAVSQSTPLLSETNRKNFAAYVEDEIKVSKRVTLNLGLRWEPFFPITETNNKLTAFRSGQQSTIYKLAPAGLVFPGDAGIPRGIIDPQYNHFAPRVGIAIDPTGSGKTSIRGSWGIYYETIRMVALNFGNTRQPFALFANTSVSSPRSLTDPYGNSPATLQLLKNYVAPRAGQEATFPFNIPLLGANSIDPNFSPPRYQQWNVSVQREFFGNYMVQAAYLGSKGTNLIRNSQINPAVYIAGSSTSGNLNARRPNQNFPQGILQTEATGHSRYDAFQLSLNKRFSQGFSLLGSYAYSRSQDTTSNDGNSGGANMSSDPRNFERDYGASDFNVPHRFVLSYVWELPFFNKGGGLTRALLGGWQLGGITTLQSGNPFTVRTGSNNRSFVSEVGDRMDVIGAEKTLKYRGTQNLQYFDPANYALPAFGTFGTVRRNSLQGPVFINTDLTVQKLFRIRESTAIELRWEIFNVFNRANFFNPVETASAGANFGRITSARDPRIMQLAAKFRF